MKFNKPFGGLLIHCPFIKPLKLLLEMNHKSRHKDFYFQKVTIRLSKQSIGLSPYHNIRNNFYQSMNFLL